MKKLLTTAALLFAVAASPVLAQQPQLPPQVQAEIQAAAAEAFNKVLPPEERARIEAAQKKTLEDPAIKAGQQKLEALQKAIADEAVKADPALAAAFEKMEKNKGNPAAIHAALTPEEKGKLEALFGGKTEFQQAVQEFEKLVQSTLEKVEPDYLALAKKGQAAQAAAQKAAQELLGKHFQQQTPAAPAPAPAP